MNQKKYLIFVCFVLILSMNLVSSQPPFQQQDLSVGLIIEVPLIEYHQVNTPFAFHTHIYNATTGKIILPGELDYCQLHLYSPVDGEHIIDETNGNMSFNVGEVEMEYDATAGNFSEIGQYAVLIFCVKGDSGGFVEYPFIVSNTGEINVDYQGGALYSFIALMFILYLMGASFSKEKWKIRSFFYSMALLVGIILVNSTLILFSMSPSLISMGGSTLILAITIFSVFLLYILISYTIEVVNQIKNVKQKRRELSDPY